MSEQLNETTPNSVPEFKLQPYHKFIGFIFFIGLFYFVNRESPPSKTKAQTQYENWLEETENKTQTSLNNEALPDLTLTIIPNESTLPSKEELLTANNIAHGRDRILRLLQLIKEAGLYDYQTEAAATKPGDILLKIQGPDKTFLLKFREHNISANIKATLMLKLFDEYSKDKIPDNLAKRLSMDELAWMHESSAKKLEENTIHD